MKRGYVTAILLLSIGLSLSGGCSRNEDPAAPAVEQIDTTPVESREAIFDFYIGDLSDPDELAKYSRVDILITDPSRFWGKPSTEGDIALLKSVNPDLKVIGFFRSKCIRQEWADENVTHNTYLTALYEASRPYWEATTEGDTLRDWPGVIVFDPADAAARKAMRDVFVAHQNSSTNKLDGVFWDYFNDYLWISPDVTGMSGEPDLDGDGVPHWSDADEKEAFRLSARDHVREMRSALGDGFIQIANGWQALQDSTFAAMLDGMFYELFPNVGFTSVDRYNEALDPAVPNNLFAASHWPRSRNGGPWLILSNKSVSTRFIDGDGDLRVLDLGDVNRAIALLANCTSVHYDLSGLHSAGVPRVELDLGSPLGPTRIDGDRYMRDFSRGRVELEIGSAASTFPVTFTIEQGNRVVQVLELPTVFP